MHVQFFVLICELTYGTYYSTANSGISIKVLYVIWKVKKYIYSQYYMTYIRRLWQIYI